MTTKRRPIYAANWKMNLNAAAARDFVAEIAPVAAATPGQVLIFPPAVYLSLVAAAAQDTQVETGAQNMFWEPAGAYTGEISADMVADCGARYVLCGHSERRHIFNESSEMVTRKASAAQQHGLIPVICVGETLEERESGETMEVLRNDVVCSLAAVTPSPQVVIAYEPVWAIGTGKVATPVDAESAIGYIRAVIREQWGDMADSIRILYGGSVKPGNTAELMECPNIDGVLVGGASLHADSFAGIIESGDK